MPTPDFIRSLRHKVGKDLLALSGVTAVVFDDDKVLLVQGTETGVWGPVTGIIDPGEEPADAAVRETFEETSVHAVPDKLAMVQALPPLTYANGDRAQFLDFVFKLSWTAGEPYPADDENHDARWFRLDQLPEMPSIMSDRIAAALATTEITQFKWTPPDGRRVQQRSAKTDFSASVAAVLFDMDGTLVDSRAVVEAAWADFATQHSLDLPTLLRFAHGRQTRDTVERFLPQGHDVEAAASKVDAEQLERTDGVIEIPGASRFLEALDDTPIAIVTSATRDLAVKRLIAAGLRVPSVLIAAEDVSMGKPSPEGYAKALGELDVSPEKCLIFEDAEAGIVAARQSGVRHTIVIGNHTSLTTAGLVRMADYTGLKASRQGGTTTIRS